MAKRTVELVYRDGSRETFEVNDGGGIASPGRFEGESLATPYFWDVFGMDGVDADASGDDWDAISPDSVDRERLAAVGCPLEPETKWFVLRIRDDGFMLGEEATELPDA